MASRFEKKLVEEMEKVKVEAVTSLETTDHQKAKGYYAGLEFALNLFKQTDRAGNDADDGDPL